MESDYEEHNIVGSKICNDLRNYHDMHIFHVSAFQSDLTASGRSFFRKNDSKGRHTTTYRQLLELPNGARIIDTPGMRELGMCDVDEGIDETFSDIAQLEAQCKFRNCRHDTEPGCAVKAAIKAGELSKERYELYRKLHAESSHAAKLKAIAKQRRKL